MTTSSLHQLSIKDADTSDYSSVDTSDEDANDTEREEEMQRYKHICKKQQLPLVPVFLANIVNESVSLAHRGLSEDQLRGVTYALKKNIKIRDLDLTDNNIQHTGALLIGKIFKRNTFISRLNLSCNKIGDNGVAGLLHCLEDGGDLDYLNLSDNQITDKSNHAIASFLANNYSVKHLDLSKNSTGEEFSEEFMKALEDNTVLEVLDLSWNNLRNISTIGIAKSLEKNVGLKKLVLSWNGYADEGSIAMGQSLLRNTCLEELDLGHNRISTDGAKGLAVALHSNSTLRNLDVQGNSIGPEGAEALQSASANNTTCSIFHADIAPEKTPDEVPICQSIEVILPVEEPAVPVVPAEDLEIQASTLTVDSCGSQARKQSIGTRARSRSRSWTPSTHIPTREESINCLKEYVISKRLRVVDLFNQWNKTKATYITADEFRRGMGTCNPPFESAVIEMFVSCLPKKNKGRVTYKQFSDLVGMA